MFDPIREEMTIRFSYSFWINLTLEVRDTEMAKRNFLRIAKLICLSFFQITWLLILIIFVILPRMIILSIRRAHIKNKVQRKLRKYGLPKEMAKIQAKKYKIMLKDYGSLRGLWSFRKEIKKKSDIQNEELVNKKNDKKIIESVNNHSSIS
jgi:hypothetical protein